LKAAVLFARFALPRAAEIASALVNDVHLAASVCGVRLLCLRFLEVAFLAEHLALRQLCGATLP